MNAEQIQALLNGATPGGWREGQDGNNRVYGPDGAGEHSGLIAVVYKGRPNARLIAAVKPIAQAALTAMAERDAAIARWEASRDALQARVNELELGLLRIDALDPESMIAGCSADAARGLVSRMGEIARALLSKGSPEKKPTDYEIKVAQKEKDFPNGF